MRTYTASFYISKKYRNSCSKFSMLDNHCKLTTFLNLSYSKLLKNINIRVFKELVSFINGRFWKFATPYKYASD